MRPETSVLEGRDKCFVCCEALGVEVEAQGFTREKEGVLGDGDETASTEDVQGNFADVNAVDLDGSGLDVEHAKKGQEN